MTATRVGHSTTRGRILYLALELGWNGWKLGFSTSPAQPVRQRILRARDLAGLHKEIATAKQRFGMPPEAPVRSCYEAGRDGFWLHRYPTHQSLDNVVVDSTSIEVNRRARRAKSGWRSGGEDFRCPRIRTGSALVIGGRGWQLGKLLP